MHIECRKIRDKTYLLLTESYTETRDGHKKNKTRVLKYLGSLHMFDDGKPNYIQRLRESLKNGAPLIECLKEYIDNKKNNEDASSVSITFNRNEVEKCSLSTKNVGYFVFDGLFDSLGIHDVLNSHKSRTKIEYDLLGITKLLIFGLALTPCSKRTTCLQNNDYLLKITDSNNPDDVYKTLDILNQRSESIQIGMNLKIDKMIGRSTEICYYDVTNYWFEVDKGDKDTVDADGNVVFQMRKKVYSKEHSSEPNVQMGLFIDDNGIPIAFKLFPENTMDQSILQPSIEASINKMNSNRVVIVADGGLNNAINIAHIVNAGNGYIVSKSVKKHTSEVKSWILDDNGYTWNSEKTFKVKSRTVNRLEVDETGNKVCFTEKLVCYWNKKYYDKAVSEHEKYLLKTHISVGTNKFKSEVDLFGYNTILTSEIDKLDDEIIEKYHGLSRIDDSFRIIKCDLESRPVFVETKEHINAHFLISFIALTMIRLLQYKIQKFQEKTKKPNETANVTSGLSAKRIKTALANFTAAPLPSGFYLVSDSQDSDLSLILSSIGINNIKLMPTLHDLRLLKYSIDKGVV
jgi:transposase